VTRDDLTAAPPDSPRWYARWWVWAGAAAVAGGVVFWATRPGLPDTDGGTLHFP
jgi:hypothetical protein